jgi:Concanavalin A-like lectin/glucanases superfamily
MTFTQVLVTAIKLLGKGYNDYINGFYFLRLNDFSADCNTPPNVNKETFSGGITTAGIITDTCFVKTGQWYNLIYTYDGIVSKIYLNGQLKKVSTFGPVGFDANNHDLFIGKHEDPMFPYYFNGVIDEIRIYNRALPLGAIKQLSD